MNTKIIKYGTTTISLLFLGLSFVLIIANVWYIKYNTIFGYDIIRELFNNATNFKLTENLLIVKSSTMHKLM